MSTKYLLFPFLLIVLSFLFTLQTEAYYNCSSYGFNAYSDGSGYCRCMSGYVWDTDIFGNKTCVSANSKCIDQYGIMSTYDSYTGKCKCLHGYRFGDDYFGGSKCISNSSYCRDKLGYNSKYNSLSDSCECNYDYEISYKTYGTGFECKSCLEKYGKNTKYNSILKQCDCKDGHTFKDGKCVEKHNSAYFILKEVDTLKKEAIIESDYTGSCYHISYNFGCYSYSIKRYLNSNVVINMGTDFYVDAWDWLVLQDDDETCELTNVKTVNCDSTLTELETDSSYDYSFLRQLLNTESCGKNSSPTSNNSCQCNAGYRWVNDDPNDFDCEIILLNTAPQPTTSPTTDDLSNFVDEEIKKLTQIDSNLTNRLKGKILLQVENKGQAWYVNPKDGKRHYMTDGNEAYKIMRVLGIGITNKDLENVISNSTFAKKHSGKIFLQVEDLGQAFYIDFNGIAHYLKDGKEAYGIMRDLGLGITDNDLNKIDIKK